MTTTRTVTTTQFPDGSLVMEIMTSSLPVIVPDDPPHAPADGEL